ncbi:histidine phosphatase superfamily [Paecilomyces variotii]|uniref:3-phytase n=1 Tax=Byssochlamys spectabilis TaxID=264951 RepID=A0A443HR05_BYSSP|nr:histidine phosphatase superfamily [Paecilomyces variotii]RWQ94221.1 histidine phosphatase superfamily [Paecilomyces variotii]
MYLVAEAGIDSWTGYTRTGAVPFLAQTNPAPFGLKDISVNEPLQTSLPIEGAPDYDGIFKYMGELSPYTPSPGFGVNEYPLPPGSNITKVQILHRHGSRYPSSGSSTEEFGLRIKNLTASGVRFEGDLSFLNDWNYELGAELLVPRGRQELFDSGVLHRYNYGRLYDPSAKVLARTTTQNRMRESAENFLAGFFGLNWQQNATLLTVIERHGFNNTLSADKQCPNGDKDLSSPGEDGAKQWQRIYLDAATKRFQKLVKGYTWTVDDTYNMQTLCPFETVAFGFSRFCQFFTYQEWKGFEYSRDIESYGEASFGSPTARAQGIGFVVELLARLQGHVVDTPPGTSTINTTLDSNERTFPTNQSIYFDFTHDTQMMRILTALGFRQFAQFLPPTGPPANQQLIRKRLSNFAARFAIEVIEAPRPVSSRRPQNQTSQADAYNWTAPAQETKYIHFVINQRTVPLGKSFPACGHRDDGWCEFDTFLQVQNSSLSRAQYEYSCFGNYSAVPYGVVTDGVPVS